MDAEIRYWHKNNQKFLNFWSVCLIVQRKCMSICIMYNVYLIRNVKKSIQAVAESRTQIKS